jgi:hypothetical protein
VRAREPGVLEIGVAGQAVPAGLLPSCSWLDLRVGDHKRRTGKQQGEGCTKKEAFECSHGILLGFL